MTFRVLGVNWRGPDSYRAFQGLATTIRFQPSLLSLGWGTDGMSKSPWFKFYCSDYLLDEKVSKLSFEAQGILVRIWCGLWIHGSLPADLEQLSLRIQVPILLLQKHMQNLMQMLHRDADGLLYSERMDHERERSDHISFVRKLAAESKHSKQVPANGHAKRHANVDANTHAKNVNQKSEVRSQILESNTNTFCLESPEVTRKLIINLPLNDNSEHPIFDDQVLEWRVLYPAVDVPQELRGMRGWLLSDPRHRKTHKGILRFVNSWLSRAQDKSRGIQPGNGTGSAVRPPEMLSGLEQVRANKAAAGGYKN